MNPPPPMPHEKGSVTPRTPAAATAASIALPPAFSSSIAACVASRSTVAAAPPVPVDVGGPDGATSAEALTPSTSATAIVAERDQTSLTLRSRTNWSYPIVEQLTRDTEDLLVQALRLPLPAS